MKIICSKSDLLTGVNIVLKAVPAKTTMPILECILIRVEDDKIVFYANDMELGIETVVKGTVEESGNIALSAKLFSDIIRKLPDGDVTISSDADGKTKITCMKSKFNLTGKQGDEFPKLPEIAKTNGISISQFTLREVIRQTVFSIADNENVKLMTGELFEIKGSNLKVASLDSHRISIRNVTLNREYDNRKVVIPGKILNEISKIMNGELEDMVDIFFSDKHVMFVMDRTVITSRLIEGEYYKVDQMISADYETKVTINKRELYDCIDRATLLVKESDKKPVVMGITDGSMELRMNTSIGSMDEEIEIFKEGKDILIGFNPKYLIEALRVIDDEEISLFFVNAKAPCFIKDKDESYIYLILPVNIGNTDM